MDYPEFCRRLDLVLSGQSGESVWALARGCIGAVGQQDASRWFSRTLDWADPDPRLWAILRCLEGNVSNTNLALTAERPWGRFAVLDEGPGWKTKRLEVLPGQRLSLQLHARRSEVWTVVAGAGRFIVGEAQILGSVGANIIVPIDTKHRIENHGTDLLVIIEVQLGRYLEEDDIVRFQDDYERDVVASDGG
jgi:mannose-6-phosphate isomerase